MWLESQVSRNSALPAAAAARSCGRACDTSRAHLAWVGLRFPLGPVSPDDGGALQRVHGLLGGRPGVRAAGTSPGGRAAGSGDGKAAESSPCWAPGRPRLSGQRQGCKRHGRRLRPRRRPGDETQLAPTTSRKPSRLPLQPANSLRASGTLCAPPAWLWASGRAQPLPVPLRHVNLFLLIGGSLPSLNMFQFNPVRTGETPERPKPRG